MILVGLSQLRTLCVSIGRSKVDMQPLSSFSLKIKQRSNQQEWALAQMRKLSCESWPGTFNSDPVYCYSDIIYSGVTTPHAPPFILLLPNSVFILSLSDSVSDFSHGKYQKSQMFSHVTCSLFFLCTYRKIRIWNIWCCTCCSWFFSQTREITG